MGNGSRNKNSKPRKKAAPYQAGGGSSAPRHISEEERRARLAVEAELEQEQERLKVQLEEARRIREDAQFELDRIHSEIAVLQNSLNAAEKGDEKYRSGVKGMIAHQQSLIAQAQGYLSNARSDEGDLKSSIRDITKRLGKLQKENFALLSEQDDQESEPRQESLPLNV